LKGSAGPAKSTNLVGRMDEGRVVGFPNENYLEIEGKVIGIKNDFIHLDQGITGVLDGRGGFLGGGRTPSLGSLSGESMEVLVLESIPQTRSEPVFPYCSTCRGPRVLG